MIVKYFLDRFQYTVALKAQVRMWTEVRWAEIIYS